MWSSKPRTQCAACKTRYLTCNEGCVFAPYFPPDQCQQFGSVERVYGADNVAAIINTVPAPLRGDAVSSLVYESQARINDPVYGCERIMYRQQKRLDQLESELLAVLIELGTYRACQGPGTFRERNLLRNLEHYQQQEQRQQQGQGMMFNSGFDGQAFTPIRFAHLAAGSGAVSPSVALVTSFVSQIMQLLPQVNEYLQFAQQLRDLQIDIQRQNEQFLSSQQQDNPQPPQQQNQPQPDHS